MISRHDRVIAVIDPAMRFPETTSFNRMARVSRLPMSLHMPGLFGWGSWEGRDLAGIILLGSIASANDMDLPWRAELDNVLNDCCAKKIPLLGICFGHQYIARMFGATVRYVTPDQTKLTGFRAIQMQPIPQWQRSPGSVDLPISHEEMVADCPRGFRVLGKSDAIAVDALQHEALPIWTFQAHPEATRPFLARIFPEATASELDGHLPRLKSGHALVDSFLDYAATV